MKNLGTVFCAPVLIGLGFATKPMISRAADYTKITVELYATWRSQTLTNYHSVEATCIVGSNRWFFSGEFSPNAKSDFWLVDTNFVEYGTITSSTYLEQAKEVSNPRAGERFIRVHPFPAFGGMDGVVWLAFCSGDYLKQLHRQIPMPIGPSSEGFGYADKTVPFHDSFGLPESVKLFAANGTLVCEYEVLTATNFLGRTFPLQFRIMQIGQPAYGRVRFGSTTDLEGRVLSIRSGKWRELPDEVRKKLIP